MSDPLLDERVNKMGKEFGTFSYHLEQSMNGLAIAWCEFSELFKDDADQIDLLNLSAGTFFYLVNQVLYRDAMLNLCRLTDPPRQMGYENLTIRRLPEFVADDEFRTKLALAVTEAVGECAFARTWRDKAVAHSDLDVALARQATPLPLVDRERVANAVAAIGRVLELVARNYSVYSPAAFPPTPNPWGARALVHRLRKGGRS